ncbi:MAG: hypothetical protein ACP5G0_00850 [Desulfomonilia bacterium]
MARITVGLVLFLIGFEFLFFTGRLQCDADDACDAGTQGWFRPVSNWIRKPERASFLRFVGLSCLIVSVYVLYFMP